MKKWTLPLLTSLVLLLSIFAPITLVLSQGGIPNPDELIIASIGMPETCDPAWSYDTASGELIFNVYEPLCGFDRESTEAYVPMLAVEWPGSDQPKRCMVPSPPDPLAPPGTEETWYFKLRTGVNFAVYDPSTGTVTYDPLTTEDVEYSIERVMVQDRTGGPEWMFYEPLFGVGIAHANLTDPTWMTKIDNAVQRNETHVWLNLVDPYPPFQQILSQTWASILNKDWGIAHGCWDGEHTMASLELYHDPEVSPLDSPEPVMCGTGPYMLDVWNKIELWWSVVKNDDYWGGWPASGSNGFVSRLTEYEIDEWGDRKKMFLAGHCDFCYVPISHLPYEMWVNYPGEPEEYPPGIDCVPNLPSMVIRNIFFNFNISATSDYMGDAPHTPGAIHETGIPVDFFNDINVRKAFAYSFNYTQFLWEVCCGEGFEAPSPHIRGLAYWEYIWNGGTLPNSTYLPPTPKYYLDRDKAEEYFKKAFGGQVWTNGFTLDVTYNTGNEIRMVAAEMLKENVESLNSKFHVNVMEVDWPTYLGALSGKKLTAFIIGWMADYPDPHNFVFPFQNSEGDYAYFQSYSNATVDALIERGIKETDLENARPMIYWKIAQLYYEDCPSVCITQPIGRHWTRTWVQGWYYNPIYPGTYAYNLWKEWYTPPSAPTAVSASTLYGTSIPISGSFIDPTTEEPTVGYLVFIQQSLNNVTWTNIGAAITDENGCVNASVTPTLGTAYYRLNFTGYTVPAKVPIVLDVKYCEWLIGNESLPLVLLSEIGTSMEVETKTLEDILTETLTPMATRDDTNALSSEISDLRSSIDSLTTLLYASIIIAIIAIIIAIVPIIRKKS